MSLEWHQRSTRLHRFFDSATPAYLVGASVGIFLGAVLILGLTLALR